MTKQGQAEYGGAIAEERWGIGRQGRAGQGRAGQGIRQWQSRAGQLVGIPLVRFGTVNAHKLVIFHNEQLPKPVPQVLSALTKAPLDAGPPRAALIRLSESISVILNLGLHMRRRTLCSVLLTDA